MSGVIVTAAGRIGGVRMIATGRVDAEIPLSLIRRLPKAALLIDFPLDVQREIQRILDAEARPLLDERDGDSLRPSASGGNGGALDGGLDEVPPSVWRQLVPILIGVDRVSGSAG